MNAYARLGLLAALLAVSVATAQAQTYPTRNVTVVAPAAPGGLYSVFARLVASKLEQRYGKSFIVENRPGASSIVGITSVVRSPPDGHTLIIVNSTGMSVNPAIHKNLAYDPVRDVAPIALIVRIPQVLVVNAALPVRSLADLAKLAKSTPGGLTYASPGPGTGAHLDSVLLQGVLDVPLTHVPYKGMSPAINDVAGGHIPFMFSPIPFAIPLAQAGKLHLIAVTTEERVPAIPEVPAMAEIGFKDWRTPNWFMLAAPAKTPQPIIDELHAHVRALTEEAAVRQEFIKLGMLPIPNPPSPAELKGFVQSEIARWGEIVKKAGLSATK
jgi:tripartite-type tricarboxylate transporter receptor subunit TctC